MSDDALGSYLVKGGLSLRRGYVGCGIGKDRFSLSFFYFLINKVYDVLELTPGFGSTRK